MVGSAGMSSFCQDSNIIVLRKDPVIRSMVYYYSYLYLDTAICRISYQRAVLLPCVRRVVRDMCFEDSEGGGGGTAHFPDLFNSFYC